MSTKLYKKIYNVNTLWRAWNRINKKSKMHGIDGISVKDFEKRINFYLQQISKQLEKGTYTPEPATRFYIPKENSNKNRPLCLPVIKDKIVQEAVRGVIEPLFSFEFCDFSYAFRANKGPKKAIGRVSHYVRQKHIWTAVIDIENFFGTIDHKILLKFISQKIYEQPILRLIELWLKNGVIDHGKWLDVEQGISQGGVISPLLSNIYLNSFDHEMHSKGFSLIRYADDIIFMEKSRNDAITAIKEAKHFLENKLHLCLKSSTTTISKDTKGFIFLGYLFKGTQRIIAPQKMIKIQNKLKKTIQKNIPIKNIIDQLNTSITGWRNYYSSENTREQMLFLNEFLLNEFKKGLITKRKKKSLSEKIIRQELYQLEFFEPLKFSDMEKCIQKLVNTSRYSKLGKTKTTQKTVKKTIVSQKRKYEKILAEESDLVISKPGYFIGKTSRRVVVRRKGKNVREIPFFRLKNILITSYGISFSSDLIKYCAKEGIPISFCDTYGRPYAQLLSSSLPFYKLTVHQVNANTNEKGIYLARCFATGKIKNQLNLIKYYNKYKRRKNSDFSRKSKEAIVSIESILNKLKQLTDNSDNEKAISQIMGYEGQAGAVYWRLIQCLLGKDVYFKGREHKGATDLVNSMLNYGYGILYSVIHQAAVLSRLNPNIGFLHKEQAGKPTLVFDLIEEFRQPVVDKVTFAIIRKKESVTMKGTKLSETTREKIIQNIMNKLNTPVSFRGKKVLMRDVIKKQALSVAQYLNGTGKYKPYIDKW